MRTYSCAFALLLGAVAPSHQTNPSWYDQGLLGAYPSREYHSFHLPSPRLHVLEASDHCDQSYVFIEPRGNSVSDPGPMILEANGDLIYMEAKFGEAMDFRPQVYKGETYLTFWSGTDDGTHGHGSYYMLDSSYEVKYIINPANGLEGDLHEFTITADGTALMTIYEITPANLSTVGGPPEGWIHDSIFQEMDIETGELIFEWRASQYYRVDESFDRPNGKGKSQDHAWDFFHINSIDKDADGNYYISSRYMHTVTCLSPEGKILWKLGGQHSDFTDLSDGAASNFSWQHHVRWHENNTLTIFDNGAYSKYERTADYSRGLHVQLDLDHMTTTLLVAYVNPMHILSGSQGSVQFLDNGNVFVGWGYNAAYTEFSRDGKVLCDIHFGASAYFNTGYIKSYRAFRGHWVGTPNTKPDIARRDDGVYVSWNGATEVDAWKLQSAGHADAQDGDFSDVEIIKKNGFETKFLPEDIVGNFLRVVALGSNGEALGLSKVLDRGAGRIVEGIFEPIQDRDFVALQLLLGLLVFASFGFVVCARTTREPAVQLPDASQAI
ncbi:ASST-domain-containing protein [Pseudomassariella vexata]|uniref:ASST-domain-containing protein n=1 Tax=Pseudomassariella vexata TaxID=1141098 RepID=A0A1Y2DN59_9PEZI|nr:ASST-domain-containing protein [Pseudomassariella vexata]ORY60609.1 ASST-domain-containing protein [Pseudomassariella vexata]